MSEATIIFLLCTFIIILIGMVIYQQFTFRAGTQEKLAHISQKLENILDSNSDEKVMVFTDNQVLMDLATQINRLLLDRQKIRVEYGRSEIASKKMLSNISHDIKTPMTVILGYLEIIRLNGDPQNKMLKKVEMKALNVMELINQFFTLAKLEAGDMNLELNRLNINEVCRETILDFYELLTQKDFQIDINIPERSIFAQANQDALQRILFNLISNAIRYGADGKYLGISLHADNAFVYIDVIDKGKGISKEYRATVFDRLFTMEDSRNREVQGNGLGLTIAKNLALQLGGNITLNSEPFVKTVFTVSLKRLAY